MSATPVDPAVAATIAAVIGSGGSNLTVRLFTNNINPDPSTPLPGLIEATFDGYSPASGGGWNPPVDDGNGNVIIGSPKIAWTKGSDPAKGQVVYGQYVTIGTGPNMGLIDAMRYDNPQPMQDLGASLATQVNLNCAAFVGQTGAGIILSAFAAVSTGVRHLATPAFQGLRRGLLKKLAKTLKQLSKADAKAIEAAEAEGTFANLFNDGGDTDAAVQAMFDRVSECLSAVG